MYINRIYRTQEEETGRLQVDVFSEDAGHPVGTATIKIMRTAAGGGGQVEEMLSDVSGQSPVLNLPAPPAEYSRKAEQTVKPYSDYNIEVSAEGYDPVLVEGVQILSDAKALQNVYLRPSGAVNQEEIIPIEEHTLWGEYEPKIPEDDVKALPEDTGFIVLDKPVIPEYIVVHTGSPKDNSAKNYYVPFKDYIKNVASCEIYATWPEEALKANILAIISFTLNRVYTEWYRNQGKNFTITNSTAYDHAFTYGRNIFEEISQVVDEIFTNYITRPNIRQPLFTQYCDGRKVSCPNWMTK